MFQTRIIKKQLHFKQPAGTSRGVYTTRNVWYILLTDTGSRHYGVGECAPLPALSCLKCNCFFIIRVWNILISD